MALLNTQTRASVPSPSEPSVHALRRWMARQSSRDVRVINRMFSVLFHSQSKTARNVEVRADQSLTPTTLPSNSTPSLVYRLHLVRSVPLEASACTSTTFVIKTRIAHRWSTTVLSEIPTGKGELP